jgi:hypothetical protein
MTERLYKWLVKDKVSPIQNVRWPVGVGKWTPEAEPILCQSGWHGMSEAHVLTHLPRKSATLWVVECKTPPLIGNDKFVTSSMKLIRPIGVTNDRNLRLFAADCAEDVLPLFLKVFPDDTRVTECIDVARRFANGQATVQDSDAAGAAARAAGDAARAAWAAGDAAVAAEDAAWAAAWAAARAAWDAARDAARDAAWDAARAARPAAGAAAWAAARAAGGVVVAAEDAARARYSNWLVVRLESDF